MRCPICDAPEIEHDNGGRKGCPLCGAEVRHRCDFCKQRVPEGVYDLDERKCVECRDSLKRLAVGLVARCCDCGTFDNVCRDPDGSLRCSGHSIR